jgi:hypothetical protein
MTWPAAINLTIGCMASLCFTGGAANDLLGQSLAEADFNGDGLMDAVIGGSGNNGRVFVILGSSGFTAGSSFTLPDAAAPSGFSVGPLAGIQALGISVASPGAVRGGDTRHEIVIGAPGSGAVPVAGRALLVDGRDYPAAGSGLIAIAAGEVTTIDSGPMGTFGATVATLDYDGNGLVDVAVRDATSAGFIYIYPAMAGSLYAPAMRLSMPNTVVPIAGDFFGSTLAGGFHPWLGANGDVNSDGRHDLLTGSNERGAAPGACDLFFGRAPFPAAMEVNRSGADWFFQPAGSGGSDRRIGRFAGDANDDGHADMLCGDRTQNRVFYIY